MKPNRASSPEEDLRLSSTLCVAFGFAQPGRFCLSYDPMLCQTVSEGGPNKLQAKPDTQYHALYIFLTHTKYSTEPGIPVKDTSGPKFFMAQLSPYQQGTSG